MIAFLTILIVVLKVVLVIAVTAIVLIGIDVAYSEFKATGKHVKHKNGLFVTALAWVAIGGIRIVTWIKQEIEFEKTEEMLFRAKQRRLREKENEAAGDFFEESYVRTFSPNGSLTYLAVQVPTQRAREYYKLMDERADAAIFTNTEEL